MTETSEKKPAERQKVKLKKPHRHGGKEYEAGAEIEVAVTDIQWLKDHGVI